MRVHAIFAVMAPINPRSDCACDLCSDGSKQPCAAIFLSDATINPPNKRRLHRTALSLLCGFERWAQFTSKMNRTLRLFDHPDTRALLSDLSSRNCYGNMAKRPTGTASWYMPGDRLDWPVVCFCRGCLLGCRPSVVVLLPLALDCSYCACFPSTS